MENLENRLWPKDEEIEYLVYETDEFIVWIDKVIDIDWSHNDDYDEKWNPDEEKQNMVFNYVTKLECIPNDHLTKNIRINFKRMIGEAIVRNLKTDYENAMQMAKNAEEFITNRNNEQSRLWFLKASGGTALIVTVLGSILWLTKYFLKPMLGETTFFLLIAGSCGALGALLSVIMRLGKTNLNPAAGKDLHFYEGGSRIIAGCISAIIIALCVKLQLLVPIFSNINNTQVAMVLAGVIAGASERWVPSLIAKVESNTLNDSNK
ncbi:MAG: hypothetical protein NTX65_04975 [Ignavibacteriales bacterium]|nr:hypothetical protein [Ignavibacteriales bacterium]